MRKHFLAFLAAVIAFPILNEAQNPPSSLPSGSHQKIVSIQRTNEPVVRRFEIRGEQYMTAIAFDPRVPPKWDPSQPLPQGLADLEKIARAELGRIITDDSDWAVTEFAIRRNGLSRQWYCEVTLQNIFKALGPRPDSFILLTDPSGVPGRVSRTR